MHVTFSDRMVQIDDARITYRNFAGEGSMYNREGDRNFSVIIDDTEIADALVEEGWNVKIKPPREEGDAPFMHLPVKVKFNGRGPNVYLKTGKKLNKLDEESIDVLDDVQIVSVDLDIRPYDWGPVGPDQKYGRTAYLDAMRVTQHIDRFAEEDFGDEKEEEIPF